VTITCTISLIPHTPKVAVTILGRRTKKKKIRTYLEKITLDFEEGKGTRDAEISIRRKYGHR